MGAVVLVLGTGLLVFLIIQRGRQAAAPVVPVTAAVPATPPPSTLALPADARIGQMQAAGNQLVLLGEVPDGRRFLAIVDPASGRRRHLLWIVPDEAAAP